MKDYPGFGDARGLMNSQAVVGGPNVSFKKVAVPGFVERMRTTHGDNETVAVFKFKSHLDL